MLSLTVREGGILLIGDVVIRICDIRTQSRTARAHITADPSIRILRFDEEGNLQTNVRSPEEKARLESIVAAAFMPRQRGGVQ